MAPDDIGQAEFGVTAGGSAAKEEREYVHHEDRDNCYVVR
jgi:hypothetical protein